MEKFCVVLLCDKAYFHRFLHTCSQLISNGKYKGSICLVIGNDLVGSNMLENSLITDNKIIVKHFSDLMFPEEFMELQRNLPRDSRWFRKFFQYHKFYLFSTYFKQWEYILYLDCGISIFSDITPILNEAASNTLLAHSDAFPKYDRQLREQFVESSSIFPILNQKYNLDIDYFQTTMMLYDTKIIENDTFNNLLNLLLEYPISITNDQGIIALYFTNIKPLFKQLKICDENTYYYDYYSRNPDNKYIMLKSD